MEDFLMFITWGAIIAFIIGIIIRIVLASYFYEVAIEKGFDEKRYLIIPRLFGLIGFILVAALPDRGEDEYVVNTTAIVEDDQVEPDDFQ